ncbi:glycosyltransferase family 4 protein [Aureimonas psammosilenae]|uniref:glycosyltransferase family 4 protein n=1 Tax=Aureimonas psammosilenae TaxID=2495496 RepID=UPI001260C871|nr:glycosyltransferase family 4 protein [Aureimonas psammosilenae]
MKADAPTILFVVTEDWFFASHFLPLAREAVRMGLRAVVATRVRGHRAMIEATGASVVPLDIARSRNSATALGREVRSLARILRDHRPTIVHCIALRAIAIGGIACRLTGIGRPVHALTGTGFLGTRTDPAGRAIRAGVTLALRAGLVSRRTRLLLENTADARFFGLAPDDPRILVVGGAGVDPQAFPVAPLPPSPPLKLALVARMIWSKGVDTAVEAVAIARARGVDVELSLFGPVDADNPRAVSSQTLAAWNGRNGVSWHGATREVASVYAAHHAAILPSRGGEGLPRTLLEAGASGRAILTTDVPGCRDLVRDGVDGFVVPPDDPERLADAIQRLAADPSRLAAMGDAVRERIESGFTEARVAADVGALWRSML